MKCCQGRLIEEQKADILEEKLEELKEKMIEEESKLELGSNGACFVVFKHKHQAQRAIRSPIEFLNGVLARDPLIRLKYCVENWRLEKAPPYSDVIWGKLGTRDLLSALKSIFLYLLLFTFCVLLITPLTVSLSNSTFSAF